MQNQDEEGIETYGVVDRKPKGTGPGSAGQSGDTQGLPDVAEMDSESVEELVEEGQYVEAELIMGMEDAAEGDPEELRPRQVPEDDVPPEYIGQD
jgi:hypothetical protein